MSVKYIEWIVRNINSMVKTVLTLLIYIEFVIVICDICRFGTLL
jgi:hypothetical protein